MRKLVAVLVLLFSVTVPRFSYAAFNVDDTGVTNTGDAAFGPQSADDLDIGSFIGNHIIKPLLGILGLIFFCLMVYAGFLWMTAVGDEKKIAKSKSILTSAVIGAVIVIAAYALTSAFINGLTSTSGQITG